MGFEGFVSWADLCGIDSLCSPANVNDTFVHSMNTCMAVRPYVPVDLCACVWYHNGQ